MAQVELATAVDGWQASVDVSKPELTLDVFLASVDLVLGKAQTISVDPEEVV